jgi:glycerol-3-phosphate O-acyltransferase
MASRICLEINRHTVATASSVAAAALLAAGGGGITEPEFMRNAHAIVSCLQSKGVEMPLALSATPHAVMHEAVDHFERQKLVTPRRDALEPFIALEASKRVPLSYFRNGIVHFLVTIGVVSCLLEWHHRGGITPTIDHLAHHLEGCQRLLLHEFRFASRPPIREHVIAAIDFLRHQGALEQREGESLAILPAGAWALSVFAAQIRPTLETLWMANLYVAERVKAVTEERVLVSELMKSGQDLFLLGRVRFREAITKDGFASALAALVTFGVLIAEKGSGRRGTLYRPSEISDAAHNLKVELEKVI